MHWCSNRIYIYLVFYYLQIINLSQFTEGFFHEKILQEVSSKIIGHEQKSQIHSLLLLLANE